MDDAKGLCNSKLNLDSISKGAVGASMRFARVMFKACKQIRNSFDTFIVRPEKSQGRRIVMSHRFHAKRQVGKELSKKVS